MNLRGDILMPDGVHASSILEVDHRGKVAGVFEDDKLHVDEDFSGSLIVPGFVDLHIHGGGGADFMDGTVQSVRTVLETHARYGTTSLLATTLTASREAIDRALATILEVSRTPGAHEALVAGIHLEGPYICQQRRGAQPKNEIRSPDVDELAHWLNIARGYVKKITLAPELPGAMEFIRFAVSQGVVVSIGHTDATSEIVSNAIAAGATHATHLFNAMSPMNHRAPGAVGGLLAAGSVFCELVCDGVHVDPKVVKIAIRAKGADRILLITDAMSGSTMPDGDYALGGQRVLVSSGEAKFADGTLAGSVLTMNHAFLNAIAFTGCSLVEAAAMSSLNPATQIGLGKDKGSIVTGKDADLTILNPADGKVLATIKEGGFLYRRNGTAR